MFPEVCVSPISLKVMVLEISSVYKFATAKLILILVLLFSGE